MVEGSMGKEGKKFFPLIFCLFIFILMCNVLGLTPYSFTVTSHISVTFTLAMIAFLAVTIFAIARNGFLGFFHMSLFFHQFFVDVTSQCLQLLAD